MLGRNRKKKIKKRNHGQQMEHLKHSPGSLTPSCGCSHELWNQPNCFLNHPAISAFQCLQCRNRLQRDLLQTMSASLQREAKQRDLYDGKKRGVEGVFVACFGGCEWDQIESRHPLVKGKHCGRWKTLERSFEHMLFPPQNLLEHYSLGGSWRLTGLRIDSHTQLVSTAILRKL